MMSLKNKNNLLFISISQFLHNWINRKCKEKRNIEYSRVGVLTFKRLSVFENLRGFWALLINMSIFDCSKINDRKLSLELFRYQRSIWIKALKKSTNYESIKFIGLSIFEFNAFIESLLLESSNRLNFAWFSLKINIK